MSATTLRCSNCHLDAGRLANSAPLAQAYVRYPAFRKKTGQVDTFEERLQGCFRYSMNGKPPPLGDKVLTALTAYAFFLAKGAPTGAEMPGRGYPVVAKPPLPRDYARGETVFGEKCAACHGADGAGQKGADGAATFPALWGPQSYNWGAGMESISNAAGFIKANMPYGQGWSLSDQEAWDVATFVDSHERPQDPRFETDVATTRARFHDTPNSMYGRTVGGVVLGSKSPPSGGVRRNSREPLARDLIGTESLAGGPGFEPRLTESESVVLPLNYPPSAGGNRAAGLSRGAPYTQIAGAFQEAAALHGAFHT